MWLNVFTCFDQTAITVRGMLSCTNTKPATSASMSVPFTCNIYIRVRRLHTRSRNCQYRLLLTMRTTTISSSHSRPSHCQHCSPWRAARNLSQNMPVRMARTGAGMTHRRSRCLLPFSHLPRRAKPREARLLRPFFHASKRHHLWRSRFSHHFPHQTQR